MPPSPIPQHAGKWFETPSPDLDAALARVLQAGGQIASARKALPSLG